MRSQIVGNTSNILWSTGSHMSVEIGSGWLWIVHELGDVSLDGSSDLLLDCLKLLLGSPGVLDEHVLHQHYWVSVVSHVLDFISASISNSWIGHGVTVVSVSHVFNEKRSILDTEFF